MSWFLYGQHTTKHIGVWLRYRSNPDIVQLIKKSRQKRLFESVVRVVVKRYDQINNKVWLEVWCDNVFEGYFRNKHRFNVFYIYTTINPNWVCEGDLSENLFTEDSQNM